MLVLTNLERRILYLSQPYCCSVHDDAMMKSEFDPDEGFWFDEMGIYVDLGFLGTHNDYQADRLFIPYKRPRRKSKNDPIIALNDQQKTYNKLDFSILGCRSSHENQMVKPMLFKNINIPVFKGC